MQCVSRHVRKRMSSALMSYKRPDSRVDRCSVGTMNYFRSVVWICTVKGGRTRNPGEKKKIDQPHLAWYDRAWTSLLKPVDTAKVLNGNAISKVLNGNVISKYGWDRNGGTTYQTRLSMIDSLSGILGKRSFSSRTNRLDILPLNHDFVGLHVRWKV